MSASHSVQSVEDTALGFTQAELLILRHQQQVLQQRSHQSGTADRGRGTSRHSVPSSRAVSAASSQNVPNRVVLDPRSLQSLHLHFDNLMRTIGSRISELEDATETSVNSNSDRAGRATANADAEIARMRRIIAEIDKLEADFARVKNIRDRIKQIKARVDAAGDRLDRSRPSATTDSRSGGHNTSSRHDPARQDRHGDRHDQDRRREDRHREDRHGGDRHGGDRHRR